MQRLLSLFGSAVRVAFLLTGVAIGLGMLYAGGPGWKDLRPGTHRTNKGRLLKTTANRVVMLGAGVFFAGGSAYFLAMTARDARDEARWKR